MVLFSRQMNVLCKYAIRKPNSFPIKIKVLETSKNKSHVCAFLVSASHQYSTLQNEKTAENNHFLNRRLLAASVASHHHISTDNAVYELQGFQTEGRLSTSVADGTAAEISPVSVPAEQVFDSAVITASGEAETVVSTGDLSESLTGALTDAVSVVDNVEVPLSALGLAGWTPVGLVQQYLEFLHLHFDLPWFGAIALGTLTARILLFPVLVKAQQNAAKMANLMPRLQVLQEKFNRARRNGNALDASKYGMEIQLFMKQHNLNPMKSIFIPLIQAPVFISFFLALRSMAKLPVESFKTGGFSWLMDLTIPDPYYITPVITCATLYIVIKIGAESGVKLENMKLARYVLTAFPILLLPFTINFPAAVLCYWCTNNFITLGSVTVLRQERIRRALNIPKIEPLAPEFKPVKKGFIKGIKDAIDDQKTLNVVADRLRIDEMRFRKAGTGPVPRTYAYDPTKPRPAAAAAARKVQAKEYKA